MKRDMDLIREIVLKSAELAPGQYLTSMEGIDGAVFSEHAKLLKEAGLVDALIAADSDGEEAFISRLTWDGHNFADEIANDTLWTKAKSSVIKPGASFTFGLLRDWLKDEIRQGFPTVRTLN